MATLNFLEKEFRLRKLFAELVKRKDCQHLWFNSDLFNSSTLSRSEIKSFWREHIADARCSNKNTHLYIHIPFCRQLCTYCNIYKWIYAGEPQLGNYVKFVIREIRSVRGLFRNVRFKSLFLGGGSPSILTEKQLKDLFFAINNSFVFDKQAVKTFEYNPCDSTRAKMQILADSGINRISFGVQSFDGNVIRHAKRGSQNYGMIQKAFQDVRRFPGLKWINADLLIGLWNDTPQTVMESFIKLAELNVDMITIYPLELKPNYSKRFFNDNRILFDQQLADKLHDFTKLVMPMAEKLGYVPTPARYSYPDYSSWEFWHKNYLQSDPNKTRYGNFGPKIFSSRNSGETNIPYDLLGIGVNAASKIANIIYYKTEGSLSSFKNGNASGIRYRGIFLSDQRNKFLYILKKLQESDSLSICQYKDKFGSDIQNDFRESLSKLRQLRAITVTDETISWVAKHRGSRFAYLLFFVDTQTILTELDKMHSRSHALA